MQVSKCKDYRAVPVKRLDGAGARVPEGGGWEGRARCGAPHSCTVEKKYTNTNTQIQIHIYKYTSTKDKDASVLQGKVQHVGSDGGGVLYTE